jgi:thiamine biosynthesis lipoprotein
VDVISRCQPLSILLGLTVWHGPGPVQTRAPFEFTQVHMGMPVRMVLYAAAEADARRAAASAFARVAALEQIFSDYRPDSEVSRLAARAEEWVAVSPELLALAERAIAIARETDGAFDPTVGPLVALWREARRTKTLPPAAAIESARARVGWQRIDVDEGRRALRLTTAGMRLDFGGIAKGYILGEVLRAAANTGVPRALIEAGGDIVVGDAPPGRDGWRIDTPAGDDAIAARARRLRNAAIATSGPTAQFVEIDGIRYSHVIDPRRGIGLTHGLVARVIAPDGATADALATAATVLGFEGLPQIRARFPSAAISLTLGPAHRPQRRAERSAPWIFADRPGGAAEPARQ